MIPAPPDHLPRPPRIVALEPGSKLVRIYRPDHGDALALRTFGPLFRMDHHPPPRSEHPEHGIWYAAMSLTGAVAEAFGDRRFVDKESGRKVALVETVAPLPLIDLVGASARRIGLDRQIGTTRAYEATQAWARRLHEAVPEAVGLRWRGRQAGTILIALTERRPVDALSLVRDCALGEPAHWPRILRAARALSLRLM